MRFCSVGPIPETRWLCWCNAVELEKSADVLGIYYPIVAVIVAESIFVWVNEISVKICERYLAFW